MAVEKWEQVKGLDRANGVGDRLDETAKALTEASVGVSKGEWKSARAAYDRLESMSVALKQFGSALGAKGRARSIGLTV